MGSDIKLRPFSERDIPALSVILRDLWHDDVAPAQYALLEATRDLIDCLSRSDFAVVAELDGDAVGICSARLAHAASPGDAWEDRLAHTDQLMSERYPDQARHYRIRIEGEHRCDGQLIEAAGITMESELVVLALGERARGHGAGRELLQATCDRLVREGARAAYLFTDSDCTWQFYEHLGFSRAASVAPADADELDLPDEMYLYRTELPLAPRV